MKDRIFRRSGFLAAAVVFVFLSFGAAGFGAAQEKKNDPSIPPGLRGPLDEFLIADAEPPLRLSDVQRVAAMFELVADAALSHEQKEEFQRVVEAEWRAANRETMRFIDEWNAFADRLGAIKKYADRTALKEQALPALLADLKRHRDDPKRLIMRQAYRRAHGANSLGAYKAEPKILKTSGTIKDVRGDWATQTGAGGAHMKTVKLSILANGRAMFSDSQSGQKGKCFASETRLKEGTAEVAGSTLKFEFPIVRVQRLDSCRPDEIGAENLPSETLAFSWQIKTDENEIPMLCLTDANGKTACYRKTD